MAKTYTQQHNSFMTGASGQGLKSGFTYTFRQNLMLIPGTAGHLVDTLLGLDGVFFDKDQDNYLNGPFGFLFSAPFLLVGTILGFTLQTLFNIPRAIGYAIDSLLGLDDAFVKISKIHPNQSIAQFFGTVFELLTVFLFSKPTGQPLPDHMKGPFGFALGHALELIRYTFNRLSATLNSVVKFIVDNICDGVRFIYAGIKSIFVGNKKAQQEPKTASDHDFNKPQNTSEPKPDADNHAETKQQRKPGRKTFKRPEAAKDPEVIKALSSGQNLFALLGITLEDFNADSKCVKKARDKLAITCHPDKLGDKTDSEKQEAQVKWDSIQTAYNILSDKDKAYEYVRLSKNIGFFSGSSNTTQPKPASPIVSTNNKPDTSASSKSQSSTTSVNSEFKRKNIKRQ